MPRGFASCLGGCADRAKPPSIDAGPNLTTSIYETRLAVAAFTWSRTFLGLSLGADLRLSGNDDEDGEPLRFLFRPWLLWKRRGSRHFRLRKHPRHRCVDFAWDLSRARFQTGGRPEPASGFFVSVAVDGEMLFVAGDLVEEAYRKTRARRPKAPFCESALTSRREHVVLGDPGGRRCYLTMARFGGRDRQISIDLGGKEDVTEAGMAVAIDGERILHVRRLQWKFRGTEKVKIEGEDGARIQISWDLHDWLFHSKDDTATAGGTAAAVPQAAAERGRAIFVFRFELEEEEAPKPAEEHIRKVFDARSERHFWSGAHKATVLRNLSGSSSNGDSRPELTNRRRYHHRRKSLLKTISSCSSTSSVSSASSSTVTDWASQEEEELQRQDGFSLLVYISKS